MKRLFDRAALDALLRPRSVAVVGASERVNVGGRMFRNMLSQGFEGPVWPINPNYQEIGGRTCYPDIASLPQTPDCIAIAVPYDAVFAPLEAAAERGVKSAVVVAEGFADAGTAEGSERQKRLVEIARAAGMAISGPNSQGLVGLGHGLATAFTNLPKGLVRGSVSLVSQSGGLLNAVVEHGHNRTLGFNYLLSAGNEAVVSAADYIEWLADDPGTNVIMNIVEGVPDGRRYRECLTYAASRKPVVVLKLGRTEAGSRAAAAHTGSLAGSQRVFDAALRDTGAAVVKSIDQLVESAKIQSTVSLPKGDRIFVFSVSGGATVLSGDLASDAGLNLPPVPDQTSKALGEILGVERRFHNPMDVVGAPRLVKGHNLTRCLDVLMREETFDAVALVMVVQRDISESHQVLHEQFRAYASKAPKPIVLISEMTWLPAARPTPGGPPIAATLDDGLLAVRHLVDHSARRRSGPPRHLPLPPTKLLDLPKRRPLTEPESYRVLAAAGLPVARYEVAEHAESAVEAALRLGAPVALKAVVSGLAHKSDTGAVSLGLSSSESVRRACSNLQSRLGQLDGFLVQEMVSGGVEIIIGARYDRQFGPVVLVGAGGTLAELMDDTALALAPIDTAAAHDLMSRLKISRLLQGFRGGATYDEAALVEALVRFSQFVAEAGSSIAEVDLNPVMVLPKGRGVRIVDALIVPQTDETSAIDVQADHDG